jgi:outer membrane protein TolC
MESVMMSRACVLAACRAVAPLTLAVSFVLGCGPSYWARDADAEVGSLLQERQQEVLASRESDVKRPSEEGEQQGPPGPAAEEVKLELDLKEALRQAVKNNRDYQTQRENLYLQGLGLTLVRHNFGPIFKAAVVSLYSDNENQPKLFTNTANLSVSQILPTGGNIRLDGLLSHQRQTGAGEFGDDSEGFGSSAAVVLTQPLLRNAGYMVSHEPLTQAERSFVYAIRNFELFREQFSIDIARAYYGLVSSRRQVINQEENARNFTKLRETSEAMRQVDRATQIDVVIARRSELTQQNTYITALQQYEFQLDQFKILLGLSTETKIDLKEEPLELKPVAIDERESIEIALYNRIDITTQRQQLEDADRQVQIAANGLLPDLNLEASYLKNGSIDQAFGRSLPEDRLASVGVRLEIPLDRKAERNDYRASMIQRDQVQRSYSLLVDSTGLQVRSDLRELKRIAKSIEIAQDGIESEKKGLAIARVRYENGEIGSRDVTETQQNLLTATNGLIQLQVDYVIARLTLLKDLGLLFIDDEGKWQE